MSFILVWQNLLKTAQIRTKESHDLNELFKLWHHSENDMKAISHLDLSNKGIGVYISGFSEFFSKATNLQTLVLSSNDLKELPESIAELTALKTLDLSNNKFKEFPKEVLSMKSLEKLDLSNNQINHLPVEISQMSSLKKFCYEGNPIKNIDPRVQKFLDDLNK